MSRLLRIVITACMVAAIVFCIEVIPRLLAEHAAKQAVNNAMPGIVKQQVDQTIQSVARDQIKEMVAKQLPALTQTRPATEPVTP